MTTLPNSDAAERAVLGSILLNREAIASVADWLRPGDFYQEQHARIYDAALSLFSQTPPTPPDAISVISVLHNRGHIQSPDDRTYVWGLVDSVPTSYHIEHYAKFVRDTATRRRMVAAGAKIATAAYEHEDADTVCAEAQAALDAAAGSVTNAALKTMEEAVERRYQRIEDAKNGIIHSIPTGWADFDRHTGGLHKKRYVVGAARPGVGKTSWSLSLAAKLVKRSEIVLYFSAEMDEDQILDRLVAAEMGVDSEHIRDMLLDEDELTRYLVGLSRVREWPIYIDDSPGPDIAAIRSRALSWIARKGPVALIVIDHIGLVTARGLTKEYDVQTHVSKKLKELCKEANCTVLGLSQMSREIEKRADRRPMLADLRSSGEIEQSADTVFFIHRPTSNDDEDAAPMSAEAGSQATIMIRKHRDGKAPIDIPMHFDPSTQRFSEVERYRTVEGY